MNLKPNPQNLPKPTALTPRLWRLALALSLLPALLGQASKAATTNAVTSLISSNTAFALDLYGRLGTSQGNLFLSPYSLSTCLAMTYAGAAGRTGQQMAQALHFNGEPSALATTFGALQQLSDGLQTQDIQFRLANGLWAQQDHPFLPAFLNNAATNYEAALQQVDFTTQAEPTRQAINQWVAGKTENLIQDLLPSGFVSTSTRLVLVNAIYFKGAWASAFDTNQTRIQPFHLSSSQDVNVPLMHQTAGVRYFENDLLQAVEIPYRGSSLTMVVLLPRGAAGLGQLEAALTAQALSQWLGHMMSSQVELFLPKFKLETSFNLVPAFQDLGMSDAFDPNAADFSGMDGARDLYISGIVHKAFVEVDEQGTKAAAATGVGVGTMASPLPSPVFRADHPFIFLIRDSVSGSLFFLGRLTSPENASATSSPDPTPASTSTLPPVGTAYGGLFYDTNQVSLPSSGYFSLTVDSPRHCSGSLVFADRTLSFSAKVPSPTNQVAVLLRRPHESTLTLTLQLPPSGSTLMGTISNGSWTAQLVALAKASGYSRIHPVSQTGQYTLTLLGDSDGTTSPGYGSHGWVSVNPEGKITLLGALADGAPVNQSVALCSDGTWPLFVPLYAGKGSLLGWVNFTNQPSSRFNGTVSWLKSRSQGYFRGGFTNQATVLGSSLHR